MSDATFEMMRASRDQWRDVAEKRQTAIENLQFDIEQLRTERDEARKCFTDLANELAEDYGIPVKPGPWE